MGLLNLAMTGDAAAVWFARLSHNDAGVVELHRQHRFAEPALAADRRWQLEEEH